MVIGHVSTLASPPYHVSSRPLARCWTQVTARADLLRDRVLERNGNGGRVFSPRQVCGPREKPQAAVERRLYGVCV